MFKYILICNRPGGEIYCGRGCNCLLSSWGHQNDIDCYETPQAVAIAIASFEARYRDHGEVRSIVITPYDFVSQDDDSYNWDRDDGGSLCDLDSSRIPDEIFNFLSKAREEAYLATEQAKKENEQRERERKALAVKEARDKRDREEYERLQQKFGD